MQLEMAYDEFSAGAGKARPIAPDILGFIRISRKCGDMPHHLRPHFNPCEGNPCSGKRLHQAHVRKPVGRALEITFVQPAQGLAPVDKRHLYLWQVGYLNVPSQPILPPLNSLFVPSGFGDDVAHIHLYPDGAMRASPSELHIELDRLVFPSPGYLQQARHIIPLQHSGNCCMRGRFVPIRSSLLTGGWCQHIKRRLRFRQALFQLSALLPRQRSRVQHLLSTVIQFLPLSVIEKLPPLLVSCLLRSGLADQTGFDLFLKPIGVSSNIDSSGVMEDAVEDG